MREIFALLKRLWLSFAHLLGRVNTIILLTIVYVIAVGLMSIIIKILRKDLLLKKINPALNSYWLMRSSGEQTLERHKFQF